MDINELRKIAGLQENDTADKQSYTIEFGPSVGSSVDYVNVIVENASSKEAAHKIAYQNLNEDVSKHLNVIKTHDGVINNPRVDTHYVGENKKKVVQESHRSVVKVQPAKNDQEIHDRINALKKAGIEASSGARNSLTDILVNKDKEKEAKDVLKKAGHQLVENKEQNWKSSTVYEGQYDNDRLMNLAGLNENENELRYDRVTKGTDGNYKTVVFKSSDGREVYPVQISKDAPDNMVNQIINIVKKFY